jgi:hypothetical protein
MSHLGRWLSAQVDGELDGVERDRILNHMAGCEACRDEANALRALKRRMTALGDSAANTGIASRLMELPRSDQDLAAPPARAAWAGLPAPAGLGSRQPWLTWRIATGSAGSALLAIGVVAFILGGGGGAQQDRPVPRVTPAVDAYWTEHIFDTGQLPGTAGGARQSVLPVPGVSGGIGGPSAPAGPGPAASGSAGPTSPAGRPAGRTAHPGALIRLDVP